MLPEFRLFGEHFYTYPLLVGFAWALSYVLCANLKIFHGRLQLRLFFIGLFITSWLGAKLLYLLIANLETLNSRSFWFGGGFVFYGGLILGSLFVISFFKCMKLPVKHLNQLIPILALSHAVGRLGCYLTGCCYGELISDNLRHPTQLYECLFLLMLAGILYKRSQNGLPTVTIYLLVYSLFRFIVEFFRGDQVRGILGNGISTSQLISLIIIVVTLITYRRAKNYF